MRAWLRSAGGRLCVGAGVALAAYVAWLVLDPPGPAPRIAGVLNVALCLAASVAALVTSRRASICARTRRAWLLCGLGMLVYAFSNAVWLVFPLIEGPFTQVAWADLAYFAYYPLLLAGLFAFPTPRRSRSELLKLSLDVGTVMLAGGAVIWHLILDPVLNAMSPGTSMRLVTVAYPVADLAVVAASVFVLFDRPSRRSRQAIALLAVASLAVFGADLAYGWFVVRDGGYEPGTWTDGLWLATELFWFAAAQFQLWKARRMDGDPALDELGAPYIGVSLFPYLAVAVGFGLLLYDALPSASSSHGVLSVTALILTALVVARQVTAVRENARLEAERAAQEGRFRSLVQHSYDVIAIVGAGGEVRLVSPSIERILGWSASSAVGRLFIDLVHPDDAGTAAEFLADVTRRAGAAATTVCRVRHGSGGWRHLEVIGTNQLGDPAISGVVLNTRDVSERIRLEAELTHQAHHDALTGLANRARFRAQVQRALGEQGGAGDVAVLLLDLDNFKNVNDSLGHLEGDRLLVEVAARLLRATRGCDTVARLGGDEFAVLMVGLRDRSDAEIVAQRITQAVALPVALDGGDVVLSASLGIAHGSDVPGVDDLLRNADVAMYVAKRRGRAGYVVFESGMHAEVRERVALEADLRRAAERGQLRLEYQPVMELATGEMHGVEALLRWTHPERGPIPPGVFIPLAEESELIVSIGRWVLREAVRQGLEWQARWPGAFPFRIAVNVSSRQLKHPAFVGEVAELLRATGYPASRLTLEITETGVMRGTEVVLERMEALKALGVRLSVDDFGTGYSSLGYLQQFPIDVLKIDKTFVDRVTEGGSAQSLARVILAIGGALSLRCIAEGVESAEQAEALRAMGCELAQGYHFSRPVSPETIASLLADGGRLCAAAPSVSTDEVAEAAVSGAL